MSAPATSPGQNRAYALDALRGIAILAMILSGQLPFGQFPLPAWMYHAQNGPPTFELNKTAYGITWVDLVFPFFLFCMGAAFPLSLKKKMSVDSNPLRLGVLVVERGILLGFFAFYVEAIRPGIIAEHPTPATQVLALLGFVIMFPLFCRLPERWTWYFKAGIRMVGWIGAIVFLSLATTAAVGKTQLQTILSRPDIIILVLTNMAIFGMPLWMMTRKNWLPRLGMIGFMLAIRLSNIPEPLPGWVSELWKFSPAPWFYRLYYLQYLCIVIPGTIAGDLILKWISTSSTMDAPQKNWSPVRYLCLAFVGVASLLTVLVGLKMREGLGTTLICLALCVAGWLLVSGPVTETEKLFSRLFQWGSYWLLLGLVFEPYEGGIRKSSPASISYYFVTAGLANFCLVSLSVLIDVLKSRRWFQFFIDNGQNPMIAYAGINNLTLPLLALTGVGGFCSKLVDSPWKGFLNGLFITLITGLAVSFLTRRRIFWRT